MKEPNFKLKILINVLAILVVMIFVYIVNGLPYFTNEQRVNAIMRRSLAENAEIIFTVKPESGDLNTPSSFYIVRYDDEIGFFATYKEQWLFSMEEIRPVKLVDGIGIIPLYYNTDGVCAVVSIRDDIKRVQLDYLEPNSSNVLKSVIGDSSENGVFLLELSGLSDSQSMLWTIFSQYNTNPQADFSVTGFTE